MPVYSAKLTGFFPAAVAPGENVAPKPTYIGWLAAVECIAYLLQVPPGGSRSAAAMAEVLIAGV